jgi:predicted transposase YdaD
VLSWQEINDTVCALSETQLVALMEQEMTGAKRTTVLVRLHQRYTRVRAARERQEMLATLTGTTPPDVHCSA